MSWLLQLSRGRDVSQGLCPQAVCMLPRPGLLLALPMCSMAQHGSVGGPHAARAAGICRSVYPQVHACARVLSHEHDISPPRRHVVNGRPLMPANMPSCATGHLTHMHMSAHSHSTSM